MFRNLSIGNKLAVGFAGVMICSVVVGLFALYQMGRIDDRVSETADNWMPSIAAVGRVSESVATIRRAELGATLSADPAIRKAQADRLQAGRKAFAEAQATREKLVSSAEEKALWDRFKGDWQRYEGISTQVERLMEQGKSGDAARLLSLEGAEAFTAANTVLEENVTFNEEKGGAAAKAATDLYSSGVTATVILLIAIVGLGSGAAWFIARQITTPVTQTMAVLESVAKGDYTRTLDIASRDELGRMAGALNATIEAIRAAVALTQEAADREKVQAADLSRKVDVILEVVNAAAGGDLTRQVTVVGDDAIGQVGAALQRLFTDLSGSISSIAQNAQALASASEELTSVSHQMGNTSRETSAQAGVVSAAAEQVSKNVATVSTGTEEMSASIREIAKSANEAARIAQSAVRMAEGTNQTITKLGESSAEIGQVIKVITSIAQQTNLLALNATIEAARAGEAGKGFAVVANEVKDLAKETAKATEDIRRKIEAIQTDTGSAVQAIGQIGGIIHQVDDISNTIASAVEEQTATTNEIGRNVAEAAKGSAEIARNIGSVAEAASSTTDGANDTGNSAQELARMAAELQTMVSRFRVAGSAHASGTGAPRPITSREAIRRVA